jgi:hypothetical protein
VAGSEKKGKVKVGACVSLWRPQLLSVAHPPADANPFSPPYWPDADGGGKKSCLA